MREKRLNGCPMFKKRQNVSMFLRGANLIMWSIRYILSADRIRKEQIVRMNKFPDNIHDCILNFAVILLKIQKMFQISHLSQHLSGVL